MRVFGSGRHWQRAKTTTASYVQLDSRPLQRKGWLQPGQCFKFQWLQNGKVVASVNARTEPGRVILAYLHRGNDGLWQNMEYPVCRCVHHLDTMPLWRRPRLVHLPRAGLWAAGRYFVRGESSPVGGVTSLPITASEGHLLTAQRPKLRKYGCDWAAAQIWLDRFPGSQSACTGALMNVFDEKKRKQARVRGPRGC